MKFRNLNILVTGGAGFIGSHLSETLAKKNRVIVYDNFSSSVLSLCDLRNLGHISNLKVIHGDILDQKKLTAAMRGVDVVFHLAVACVRLSLSRPTYVHDVNATGTLTALQSAKTAGVKRFIYVSSSEVYGTAKKRLIAETHPIDPTTVYGMSKYVGESYTRYFHAHEGLPTMIVRPFNTYGPRSHFEGVYGEVIPRFSIRALNGKQPTIFGKGNQSRDFMYVTDTIEGITRAAGQDKLLGDCINIARGKEISVSRIGAIICELTGIPYHPIMQPARPNDVMRHAADIKKAKGLLSYNAKISINDGLSFYISWLKKTYPHPKMLLNKIPNTNW